MTDRIIDRVKKIPQQTLSLSRRLKNYPQEWFQDSLETAVAEKRVTESKAAIIRKQINEPSAVMQLTDIFVCSVAIRAGLKPFDFVMGASAIYHEDPTYALYIFAAHSGSRLFYLGSRIARDRVRRVDGQRLSLKRDLLTLLIAASPIPYSGEFAAPYRATSHPELGSFAMKDTAHKIGSLFKYAEPNNHNLPTMYKPL